MKIKDEKGINSPIFNEFLYTLLYQADYKTKRLLKGKFLQAAMSQAAAKRFIKKASREDKELLLSELGIQFFYVIHPKDIEIETFKNIFQKIRKKQIHEALTEISESKIFVTSDEQLIDAMRLSAKAMHHPNYFLNLELLKAGYNIKQWRKRANIDSDAQSREASESDIAVVKLILACFTTMSYCVGLFEVTQNEMLILLYLYVYKHMYLHEEGIKKYFLSIMSPVQFRYAIKGLLNKVLIRKGYAKHNEYSISSRGITRVADFRDKAITLQA